MAVSDEDMTDVRSRVHALEVEHRGQLQLTSYVLGRLGSIDEALVDQTKLLVESKSRQDRMEERLDRMEHTINAVLVKLDALPAALAALIKPAND